MLLKCRYYLILLIPKNPYADIVFTANVALAIKYTVVLPERLNLIGPTGKEEDCPAPTDIVEILLLFSAPKIGMVAEVVLSADCNKVDVVKALGLNITIPLAS